jgi:hypothetical protein
MKTISEAEIVKRIHFENPWWTPNASIDEYFKAMKPRAYLDLFYNLVTEEEVNRAVVLMGPRRVGKTVMIYHTIQKLIGSGIDPKRLLYISIEAPVYTDLTLEQAVRYYLDIFQFPETKGCYIFFDEIQYLKNWEIHLKKLVDDYRELHFVVSGSAAAALRLKSIESGAGRFTNFLLPPLTFHEYLYLLGKNNLISETERQIHNRALLHKYTATDITALNEEFINYLNFGGYPEALFSEAIKADPQRYIRSDIIDKVLMRDLPSLYGIDDIQELNRLFTMLAYNTGAEVSLDELSKGAGVAKNTIKKYIEYLEAAFLIRIFHRVDQSGNRFKRENFFKVYLTNPSIRCALFGPIKREDSAMGNMVETAIISQWLHTDAINKIYYSRWASGEVDLVYLTGKGNEIAWCVECKWTNRFFHRPDELTALVQFMKKNKVQKGCRVTTFDVVGIKEVSGVSIEFSEASVYCYTVGRNITRSKSNADFLRQEGQDAQ